MRDENFHLIVIIIAVAWEKKSIFCERDEKIRKIETYIFCYKGEKLSPIRRHLSFSFSGKPGYKQSNNLKCPLLWFPALLSLGFAPCLLSSHRILLLVPLTQNEHSEFEQLGREADLIQTLCLSQAKRPKFPLYHG